MKIANWLKSSQEKLESASVSTPRLDVQLIACNILGQTRAWLLAHPDFIIEPAVQASLDNMLQRRLLHEPLAYIFGQKEFYGRSFTVNKHVLVPRPDSEDVIELALGIPDKAMRILDIGTGSGILAITIALERPEWTVTASDISSDALFVAKANSTDLGVNSQVEFIQQDLLTEDIALYNLVIANLPYVPDTMATNSDLAAEPSIALFSGHDGLDHYRRLFEQLGTRTPAIPNVITESLVSQHSEMTRLASDAGYTLNDSKHLAQHFTLG